MSSNKETISNPNKSLQIPTWLDQDYFIKLMKKNEPGFMKILKFTPVAAIPPGENFTSAMLRIHLDIQFKDGSVQSKSYIMKTMLDGEIGQALRSFGLFPKEAKMYQLYIPAFEELYRKANFPVQLAPKCLQVEQHDDRIDLIFEDLKPKKFQNCDRTQGLDMDHMIVILKKIAEFHAASAVYAEQNGPFPEEFKSGFVSANAVDFQKSTYQTKRDSHIVAMKDWCKTDEEKSFIDKMPTVDQYWTAGLKTLEPIESDFNCLLHGDFWSSNIMFTYNSDGTIKDSILVDLQLCKWGSPCEDLQFFFIISAARDIRLKEYDRFIQIYHEHLAKCLRVLGYKKPIPKLREIHMAMFKENVTYYAFFALINHLPIVLWPKDDRSSIENLNRKDEEGERLRYQQNSNPHFVESARDILSFYHKKGIFDFTDYDGQ